ncbi:MAG TPA: protein kinase, partial [Gemmatales bacterium]|nr:protein kinase [Gemmatales bacterium]
MQLWLQVCEAVAATHERGVIHRDIKPSNILVTEAGRVVVVDFGLARRWEGASVLTQTAVLLGTPEYMAPEQAEGRKKPITPAADLYALGAVLYKLLTGRPPFRADSSIQLITMTIHDEPVSPRRLNQAVSRDLETICIKCLEKEPTRRYESSQALLTDVQRLLRGEPISARPLGWAERSLRWMKRRPAFAALIGLLSVTILISLAVVASYWRTSNNALQLAKRATTEQFKKIVELARQPAMQRAQADFLNTWVASQEEIVRSLDDEPIYLQFLRARHELAVAYDRIGQRDKAKEIVDQLFHEIEAYSQSHDSDELAIEHAKCCMFHLITLQNPDDPQVRCPVIRKAIGILNKVPMNSPKIEETLGLIADYRTILAQYEPDKKLV